MNEKRFYHALNSNRMILVGGMAFSFSPYSHICGMWMGTFVTEKEEEIKALESLPHFGTDKCHVSPLTQDEYDECQKKKAVVLQSLGQSLIHSEVSASSLPSVNHAAPLNSEPQPVVAPPPPVESVESLAVGENAMPPKVEA